MDRIWFLTWHTYGTWLPGLELGFVGESRDETGKKFKENEPGTPYSSNLPGLQTYARNSMKGPPILLTKAQADALFEQLQETARIRKWTPVAISISPSHVHVLVGVLGDPDPEKLLGDFKAWGTRALSRAWGPPASETWWTQGGSKRRKKNAEDSRAALDYIRQQEGAWIIWINKEIEI
jgi:hypothetical protein